MTVIIGILGLSFLVFFHELGHYIAARLCGVKVLAFSIGMGPVLLHHTINDTDYRISLIPLGGYCSMKGQDDFPKAIEGNLKEIYGEPDSYYGSHPFKRLMIAFAGPAFNFIFGFIAFYIIALVGYTYYSAGTKVSMADEIYENMTSVAHEAGMQTGDSIKMINGKEMNDFSNIAEFIATHPDEDIDIIVERDGKTLSFAVHTALDKDTGAGKLGIVSSSDSVVERHYGSFGIAGSFAEGAKQSASLITLTFKSISILFKGINLTNAVSGPARITTILGSTVKQGFAESIRIGIISTLQILALISISLFITNLLPVPILDGGLILFALIEWIARRKMHPRLLYYIQYVGVGIIALLIIFVTTNDIKYFLFK